MKSILSKLKEIQNDIVCKKGKYNEFGKFYYRSCEDILEAVKPICAKNNAVTIIEDEIVLIGDRYYIKATAYLYDIESGEKISSSAYAREPLSKKGADEAQVTGASSSYARKYALAGLFSLDDNKDADTMDNTSQEDKDKVLKSICRTIRANKIDNGLVTKIIENKYRKFNSKQLTLSELKDLDKNILNYVSQY